MGAAPWPGKPRATWLTTVPTSIAASGQPGIRKTDGLRLTNASKMPQGIVSSEAAGVDSWVACNA